jgi:hypothetical protein
MSLGSDIVVSVVLIRVQHVFTHLIQANIVIADDSPPPSASDSCVIPRLQFRSRPATPYMYSCYTPTRAFRSTNM